MSARRAVALKVAALLVGAALALVTLQGCGDDDSGGAPPTTESGTTAGNAAVETERLPLAAVEDPEGAEGTTLSVSRVTIAVGDVLDPHYHEGQQTAFIEKGTLTYTVIEGQVPVYTGSPEENPELVREIAGGETADLEPGEWVIEDQSDIHTAENRGDVPVEIILTSLLRTGAAASTPVDEE
ncbi:MAG: hypothetical protein ACFB50_06320 [Rubrobacteraceae bacterium]